MIRLVAILAALAATLVTEPVDQAPDAGRLCGWCCTDYGECLTPVRSCEDICGCSDGSLGHAC